MPTHETATAPTEGITGGATPPSQAQPAGATTGRGEEASVTFSNVGRLHAFLEARGQANGWRAAAPLAAMKYIQRLERARQGAK